MKKTVKTSISIVMIGCLMLTACSSDNTDNSRLNDSLSSLFSKKNVSESNTETNAADSDNNSDNNSSDISTNSGIPDNPEFEDYLNELFCNSVISDTITLHFTLKDPAAYGIEDYPVTLGSFTLDDIESSGVDDNNITELTSFDYNSLSEREKLTYDILSYSYNLSKDADDISPYYSEFLSPNLGIQSNIPVMLAEYDFNSEKDVTDYITLCTQVDDYFNSVMEFEKKKASEGLFMDDHICDQVIDQCESFIENPEDNYMLDVFNDKIDAVTFLDDTAKNNYKEQHKDVILNDLIPAYNILINGMKALYGSGVNDGGLCNFSDGKKYYEYLVASNTGSDRSVDEIDDLLNTAFDDAIMSLRKLYTFDSKVFDKADNVIFPLSDPNEILDELSQKMLDDFPAAPDSSYTIKHVHPSLSEYLSPAFYIVPPIDDTYSNSIYLNDASLTSNESLYTTLCHEGYPGHLYQNLYTAKSNPHAIRSLLSFNGYSEGFASYVEMYSYGYSGIDKSVAECLKLNQILTLIMYAKADIGVNYYGWTEKDLGNYLDKSGFSSNYASDLYWYVISEPANYLRYTIGYLEFENLKSDFSKKLGKNFSLVDFHDAIMSVGPAPFSIVEKYASAKLGIN